MDDQTQAPHAQQHNIYVYIVVVVVVVFLIVGGTILKELKNPSKPSPAVPAPTAVVRRGSMTLTSKAPGNRVAQGAPIVLELTADSAGADIVTYDALVEYDAAKVDFVSAVSTVDGFQIFVKKNEGFVSLTAVKSPAVTAPTVFATTPIMTVTFRAKAAGPLTFQILDTKGQETTQMIDAQVQTLRPTVSTATVDVY